MGAVPSTPRQATRSDVAEYLIATFVGEKSFPLSSDFWHKLLELPLSFRWQPLRVQEACELFAQNNCFTRHLAKILIHLALSLQEAIRIPGASATVYTRAINAVYISSVFLKYTIENSKSNSIEELYLSLDAKEPIQTGFVADQGIGDLVMHSVISFIASVDLSPNTYLVHQELLNFMLVAMPTQLLSWSSPGLKDVNPFLDAAMSQEGSLVVSVVRRLLLNYVMRPHGPSNYASYSILLMEINQMFCDELAQPLQILCYCHSIIWSIRTMKAQEIIWLTAASACYLFSFIIANVFQVMSSQLTQLRKVALELTVLTLKEMHKMTQL